MADLEIKDLHVRIEEREILRGVDLDINRGEIHALMGPNGSGKSTLANTLLGHPSYEITEGTIVFKGEDITEAEPHERANAGLFLAFQYPVSIPGVSVANFLRLAINARRESPIGIKEFGAKLSHAVEMLEIGQRKAVVGGDLRQRDRILASTPSKLDHHTYAVLGLG